MIDEDKLKMELRQVEDTICCYDLAKKLGVSVDELLEFIQNNIMIPYKEVWTKNKFKIPFYSEEQIKEFYQQEIIDLGMLVQHHIKEIKESMGKLLKIHAHQITYNNWMLYRGY